MGEVQPPPPRAGPTPVDRVPGRTPDCTPLCIPLPPQLPAKSTPPKPRKDGSVPALPSQRLTTYFDLHSAVGRYNSIRTYHRYLPVRQIENGSRRAADRAHGSRPPLFSRVYHDAGRRQCIIAVLGEVRRRSPGPRHRACGDDGSPLHHAHFPSSKETTYQV